MFNIYIVKISNSFKSKSNETNKSYKYIAGFISWLSAKGHIVDFSSNDITSIDGVSIITSLRANIVYSDLNCEYRSVLKNRDKNTH